MSSYLILKAEVERTITWYVSDEKIVGVLRRLWDAYEAAIDEVEALRREIAHAYGELQNAEDERPDTDKVEQLQDRLRELELRLEIVGDEPYADRIEELEAQLDRCELKNEKLAALADEDNAEVRKLTVDNAALRHYLGKCNDDKYYLQKRLVSIEVEQSEQSKGRTGADG